MLELFVTLQMLGQRLGERLRREDGATAAEYALILALIAVAIIGALTALGTNISARFQEVADTVGPTTAT